MLLDTFLDDVYVMGLVKVLLPCLLIVSDEGKVLSVESEGLRVVVVDASQRLPQEIGFLGCSPDLEVEFVEVIKVWYHCCKMGPELYLKVADFLYLLLHILKQSLEFFYISELFIDMFFSIMFFLDVDFNYVLIPEYSKLLLKTGPFLRCNLKLMESSVHILHYLEVEERK